MGQTRIPPETAKQGMVGLGFPEAFADGFLILQARPSGSRRSSPAKWKRSSAAPRTYAEWVTDHANDFRN